MAGHPCVNGISTFQVPGILRRSTCFCCADAQLLSPKIPDFSVPRIYYSLSRLLQPPRKTASAMGVLSVGIVVILTAISLQQKLLSQAQVTLQSQIWLSLSIAVCLLALGRFIHGVILYPVFFTPFKSLPSPPVSTPQRFHWF